MTRLELAVPRFSAELDIQLDEFLKAAGMHTAFDRKKADFRSIADIPPNIFIEKARHTAKIEVNMEGTEAAAATALSVVNTSAVGGGEVSMIVDRPFFFAIADQKTGTLLFMGSVYDPSER